MDKLYENKWITSHDADLAKKEYDTFLEPVQHEYKDDFLMYDVKSKRIDNLLVHMYMEMINTKIVGK